MRRTDLLLLVVLVVLVLILVVGLVMRPQPAGQGTLPLSADTLEGRLAAAQASVASLEAQLSLPTAVPGSLDFTNWETIAGNGASLALPAQFDGDELSMEFIDSAVEQFPAAAEVLRNYRSMIDVADIALFAYDTAFEPDGFITNINVVRTPFVGDVPADMTETFDGLVSQLPPGITVIRRDMVNLHGNSVLRLDIENRLFGAATIRQLVYTMPVNNVVWSITYSTHNAQFGEWLPIFEISARTFQITG